MLRPEVLTLFADNLPLWPGAKIKETKECLTAFQAEIRLYYDVMNNNRITPRGKKHLETARFLLECVLIWPSLYQPGRAQQA